MPFDYARTKAENFLFGNKKTGRWRQQLAERYPPVPALLNFWAGYSGFFPQPATELLSDVFLENFWDDTVVVWWNHVVG
jgi:hypothetical protein